ncbi:signal peptidase II [Rhodoplanes roseus]|uniref:Lipoprotein signal peptidase n=1 Tax=Rhodoplanes roseus TaxID=29409 RepID=A0A327KPY8_9BRAD|nr:signal peptidase II [Rhodoplanes roseus]RAI39663.1 signal peptidase II [Rhodoplanes roseus]
MTRRPVGLGLLAAAVAVALDQAVKLWLLYGVDLPSRAPLHVFPGLDLVVVWNTGISYGLFPQSGPVGQWALLGVKAAAVALLGLWLAKVDRRASAVALGLIIGGAIGNAIDRVTLGAVFDFVLLSVTTATTRFNWYVFNVADVAIVIGVVVLLYEAFVAPDAAKAP